MKINNNWDSQTLQDIGEEQIIRLLAEIIDKSDFLGRNEDAIAQEWNYSTLVANTDAMSWKSDVLPNMTPSQIGKKIVSITASDLAAKGAIPKIFMSSINLPSTEKIKTLLDIAIGIKEGAHTYGMKYLGGDMGTATEGVIVGFAIGSAIKGHILRRDGVRDADCVCVTGKFGYTGAVIRNLNQNQSLQRIKPDWIKKLLEPTAKTIEGRILNESGEVNASIDSSDGLAKSLWELANQSKKRIIITELPVDKSVMDYASKNDLNLMDLVFYGGEEYELVFCMPLESFPILKQKLAHIGSEIEMIGYVTKGETGVYFEQKEKLVELPRKGWWDAFGSPAALSQRKISGKNQ
ncbi:MAG: thiamine-phosphate kinase [Promethearchaeota archaeon]